MNLESDDLEDCIKKFRKILYKQDAYKINETDMWYLIENLTKELELSKENEICLRKNLQKCLDNEHGDITTHYVDLREKCRHFEEEVANLKVCVEDMQLQVVTDVEILKTDFLQKLSGIEDTYKREINILKEKMEDENKYHQEKEKEFYDELQLAQATTDLRCDEIESNFTRQLVESKNKLRASQNLIRTLQTDLHGLKNQLSLANQQIQSYRKPPKPEIRFQPLPVTTSRKTTVSYEEIGPDELEFDFQPPIAEKICSTPNTNNTNTPVAFYRENNKLCSLPNRIDSTPVPQKDNKLCPLPNRNTTPLVYPPREIELCPIPNKNISLHVTGQQDSIQRKFTPAVYRGSTIRNLTKADIPGVENKVRKKRKLYDPHAFDESNFPQFSQ